MKIRESGFGLSAQSCPDPKTPEIFGLVVRSPVIPLTSGQ